MADERKIIDVTAEYERMRLEMMLMRVCLGLGPAHDLRFAVQVLYDQGREAMENMRGPKSEHSHLWQPRG